MPVYLDDRLAPTDVPSREWLFVQWLSVDCLNGSGVYRYRSSLVQKPIYGVAQACGFAQRQPRGVTNSETRGIVYSIV